MKRADSCFSRSRKERSGEGQGAGGREGGRACSVKARWNMCRLEENHRWIQVVTALMREY